MNAKYKFPILILGLIALCIIQYQGFIPLAFKAAQSDLFMEDTGDEGSLEQTSNANTEAAYKQCNAYIKEELGEKFSITFADAPSHSWGLGNYEYLINADVTLNENNNAPKTERYACRIKYEKGQDPSSDINNKEFWSVLGISGVDEL